MTIERVRLLERAATCYEQDGLLLDAARCHAESGAPLAAARLYERAGEFEPAARCYEKVGDTARASRSYLQLGRADDAAGCWERAGDKLAAGWVLVTAARRFKRARWLLEDDRSGADGREVRREIAIGLCVALEENQPTALVAALQRVEEGIAAVSPAVERALALRWAVLAADAIGRHDMAAQIFAAAFRAGDREVLPRWRDWAQQTLGGTAGLPTSTPASGVSVS